MANGFVRLASVSDAEVIADIQLNTWRTAYQQTLPEVILQQAANQANRTLVAEQWHSAIAKPPSPRHQVFIAIEQTSSHSMTVGFTAIAPTAEDELPGSNLILIGHDSAHIFQLVTLLVEPRFGRRGHGSRLLAAAIDHMRQHQGTAALTWVLQADKVSRRFFDSAGWSLDGGERILEMDGVSVGETCLYTDLRP